MNRTVDFAVFDALARRVAADPAERTKDLGERLICYKDRSLPEGVSPHLFSFLCETVGRGLWSQLPDERTFLLLRAYFIGTNGHAIRDLKELNAHVPSAASLSPARIGQLVDAGVALLLHELEREAPDVAANYAPHTLRKQKPPRRRVRLPRSNRTRSQAALESWADQEKRTHRVEGMQGVAHIHDKPRSAEARQKMSLGQIRRYKNPLARARQAEILAKARAARRDDRRS